MKKNFFPFLNSANSRTNRGSAVFNFIKRLFGFSKRSYNAGKITAQTYDFRGSSFHINTDIKNEKRLIDKRAIELAQNNPYVSAYLLRKRNNVVGFNGFKLQVQAKYPDGTYDNFANSLIENKFKQWCKREYCTMNGRLSFVRVQWLVNNSLALFGEFLVQKVYHNNNPFGFSLNVLDPSIIDITYNVELNDKIRIVNGIEVDEYNKILAIHVKQEKNNLFKERKRIPIDELYYDFDAFHPAQIRGVSPLASVMNSLKGIDRFDEYSLINAGASSAKMGFIKQIAAEANEYVGGAYKEVEYDEESLYQGGKYMDLVPGIIEKLPYGYDFESFDPKFPHEQHEPFQRLNLRKIYSALGMNYNISSGDLEGISFSAGRLGVNEERYNFKAEQTMFIESFLIPVYQDWLKVTLAKGLLEPLNYDLIEKYMEHKWQGIRWIAIDPLSDKQADILAIINGHKTNQEVIEENGGDIEDVYAGLAYEKKLQEKYGIKIEHNVKGNTTGNVKNEDDENDSEDNQQRSTNKLKVVL